MKPAWDGLMTEFKDHASILIADVDCTSAGKPLCDNAGVKGYPTIKHGDPANLEDYSGGRDADSLKAFAAGLKPVCSPSNLDLCDDEGKAAIEAVMALSDADITAQIEDGDAKIKAAEELFSSELEKLQASYQKLQADKEASVSAVKDSGLGLLKSVKAFKAKATGKDEL